MLILSNRASAHWQQVIPGCVLVSIVIWLKKLGLCSVPICNFYYYYYSTVFPLSLAEGSIMRRFVQSFILTGFGSASESFRSYGQDKDQKTWRWSNFLKSYSKWVGKQGIDPGVLSPSPELNTGPWYHIASVSDSLWSLLCHIAVFKPWGCPSVQNKQLFI